VDEDDLNTVEPDVRLENKYSRNFKERDDIMSWQKGVKNYGVGTKAVIGKAGRN